MAEQHRRIRAAAVTGTGQVLGLLGSALIGVLVAGTLPPAPRVDGFFGANQIYALSLFLGQAVRITAPALLVRSGVAPAQLARASAMLTAGTIAFMVLTALIGAGLVAPPARDSFTSDLLVLAPAAGIHVAAGGMAGRLAVAGSFGYAAAAYAAGSVVAGVILLFTINDQGASALAPALLAGAVSVGVIMLIGRHQILVRGAGTTEAPTEGGSASPPPALPSATFALRRIGLGAIPSLAFQFLITVVIVAAGHVLSGGTALLSYAFLALFAFTTIAITPMSIVLGPEMAARWDGSATSLESIIRQATRLSMVVAVPLIAGGFLVGRPLAGELLSKALTDADLDVVFEMVAILTPSLLLTAAATAATVGVTTADRLGELAIGLLLTCALVFASGFAIVALDASLPAIALVASVFTASFAIVTLAVALGRVAVPTIAALIAENVLIILPGGLLTALLWQFAKDSLAQGIAAAIAVTAVHLCVVLLARRDVLVLLGGALRTRAAT